MKKIVLGLAVVAGLASCSDDDDVTTPPPFEGESKEYTLNELGDSGVTGTVTFNENEDGSTTVDFDLEGTEEGSVHPAHIHMGTAAEGGDIVVTFNPITDGASTTDVTALDGEDGETITYEELVTYDGYINVHLSSDELETVVAQADIGANELTGESVVYDLASIGESGVSGTATFQERENGETLVTLALEGTEDGDEHPAHIHMGAVADAPGAIAVTLSSVDGATGVSMTNVAKLDDTEEEEGAAINYEELTDFDGYINVHESADNLETLEAQGNIGINASEE